MRRCGRDLLRENVHAPTDHWLMVWSHRERLHRLAVSRCATTADAEDCVQEAMLRVAARSDLDPTRLGGFLTTVLINLCVDSHRDRNRSRRVAGKLLNERQHIDSPSAC